ncbi:MAG TPA: hypothetical protein VL172_08330 [Kofleriaceae bacterium]|nr:hypothetical protein [Kofleriaceae bacterium]
MIGAPDDGDGGDDDGGEPERAQSIHDRLRGLSPVEQHKIAHGNDVSQRIVLERLYGKSVWEPLLNNPRLTAPEVARIARMGALPRPLIDLILANLGWLNQPQVRRALLSNPRLSSDGVDKVLRLLPKPELRLVPKQMGYPSTVRDIARRLLKHLG